jgi:bifunctional non-homologous end joining protein LigD
MSLGALDLRFQPMAAVTGALPPDDERWAFEVKWDGVRALTYIDGGDMRMESRNLIEITARYPELWGLADAVRGSAPGGVVLDGEVATFDDQGRPSFGRLQHRMHVTGEREVRRRMAEYPVVYVAFDVLWLGGEEVWRRPYVERRQVLDGLALHGPSWLVPQYHVGHGAELLEASVARGLEGVMAKRLDTPYEPGRRSRCWLKIKSKPRQEVVIGGWLEGAGNRSGRIGALLVGYYEDGVLRFAGKVGTGFSDRTLADLAARLAPLARDT